MTDDRIIEEMARLEGVWRDDIPVMQFYYGGPAQQTGTRSSDSSELPDYLTDHNAVQRVIDGMDWGDIEEFVVELLEIIGVPKHALGCVLGRYLLKATPSQKCEAILKAKGKWEVVG